MFDPSRPLPLLQCDAMVGNKQSSLRLSSQAEHDGGMLPLSSVIEIRLTIIALYVN